MSNVANAYLEICEYEKALELYQQSLNIRERKSGKGHLSLATVLNNIGLTYL